MIDRLKHLFSNRKIDKLIDAPFKIKIIIFFVIFIIFCFIFYNFLVVPISVRNHATKQKISLMEKQIPILIKRQKNLLALNEQVEELKRHNAAQRFSIPKNHSIPIFLAALNKAITSSGMNIIDLAPTGIKKEEYLDLYSINFNAKLSGDFSQLIKLFISLIDMKDIAVITNINIKTEQDNNLLVELNLQSYSRQ